MRLRHVSPASGQGGTGGGEGGGKERPSSRVFNFVQMTQCPTQTFEVYFGIVLLSFLVWHGNCGILVFYVFSDNLESQ